MDNTLGSHTYEIKSYGTISSTEPTWSFTDSVIICTINVVDDSGACSAQCIG